MPPNAKSETEPEPAPVSGAEPAAELETANQKLEETTHHSKFRELDQQEQQQAAESQRIAQVETTIAPKTTTEAEGEFQNIDGLLSQKIGYILELNLYRSCYYIRAGYQKD